MQQKVAGHLQEAPDLRFSLTLMFLLLSPFLAEKAMTKYPRARIHFFFPFLELAEISFVAKFERLSICI